MWNQEKLVWQSHPLFRSFQDPTLTLWENTLSLHTAHTHRHTDTDTHTQTQTHTHRHTHRHRHTQTQTHTYSETHRHTHIQTHTHTHTHSAAGRAPRAPTCSAYNRCSIPADLLRIPCRADAT